LRVIDLGDFDDADIGQDAIPRVVSAVIWAFCPAGESLIADVPR
jgi:hypothetical protein